MIETPQRTSTSQVVEALRQMILSRSLAPGMRIDMNELAQQFGVSIVPVREALARLQSSGLVRIIPHRGVFVEALSVDELIDIYTVRELLEEHAAQVATNQLRDEDTEQMAQIAGQMERIAATQQYDSFLELNRSFHFALYRAAHRRTLLQIIDQLWDRSTRYRHLQLYAIPDRAQTSQFETRAILVAAQRRDADAVGYLVRYKIHQTIVSLTAVIAGMTNEQQTLEFTQGELTNSDRH
jgi:DNA-binding GntR family transcriptional regulator